MIFSTDFYSTALQFPILIYDGRMTEYSAERSYTYSLTWLPHIKGKLWISCKNGKAVKIKFYYEKQKVIEG